MRTVASVLSLIILALVTMASSVAFAQAMDTPTVNPDALANAIAAHNWQLVVASCLGVAAWAVRRFAGPTHFAHTTQGALLIGIGTAVIGALIPVLTGNATIASCIATAGTAALSAFMAMSNPTAASQNDASWTPAAPAAPPAAPPATPPKA